jgi:DNA-binding beta-propeller fold protein YncE
MKRLRAMSVAITAFLAIVIVPGDDGRVKDAAAQTRAAREIPRFEVDPSWPKLPDKWVWGQVSSVSFDSRDHAWILQRPLTIRTDQKGRAAPPVLEFDAAGNFVQGWGGPGEGYDWPEIEHGIYVDPKGFVWIGGNGKTDHHLVKFTRDGKFVMQIGRKGQSKGNKDTENVNMAADTFVYAKTNELVVADGYGNRRIIVFDADSGAFKRMWGAFGNEPADTVPPVPKVPEASRIPAKEATGTGPQQFDPPVHAARVSNDGLVYVSDRGGKRVQVFTIDGKYLTQMFIDRWCEAPHCGNGQTVASTAFSQDPQQRFLYVASRSPARIWVLDRKTLEPLDSFGRPGVAPGEFYVLHHMNVDSKGNLYTTEVQDGKRIQKFVFKGLTAMPSNERSRGP